MPILIVFFAAFCALTGAKVLQLWFPDLDGSALAGIGGLVCMGFVGTIIGLLGMFSVPIAVALGLLFPVGLAVWRRGIWVPKVQAPQGLEWLYLAPCVLGVLFALVGANAPSTALDWDSLAYHLALPKMWVATGKIASAPFIHHSNFPIAVDALFIPGALVGNETASKIVMPCLFAMGLFAVFGLTRERYGKTAGCWAAIALAGCPLVLWESGTAYIDVPNGLFAGIGFYCLARWLAEKERGWLGMGALCLSLCAESKYTGLLMIFIGAASVFSMGLRSDGVARSLRNAAFVGLAALAIASPWYIRNAVWKGNPVFPFFYSKLGGQGWDQAMADIYSNEQNSFGLGREGSPDQLSHAKLQPSRLGHAIFGLGYLPGRFVNPLQTRGLGAPLGALGVGFLGAFFVWLCTGEKRKFEQALLLQCGLALVAWFFVSQQVRYILGLSVPLGMLAGAAVVQLSIGRVMAIVLGLQSAYALWLTNDMLVSDQLRVALGADTVESYRAPRVPFAPAAIEINKIKPAKVVLYDEVFGYLLDVPYIWGNPGHSQLIPRTEDFNEYVAALKGLGASHVYLSFSGTVSTPQARDDWFRAAGLLAGDPLPDFKDKIHSFEERFKPLTAAAVKAGLLKPVATDQRGHWILLHIE